MKTPATHRPFATLVLAAACSLPVLPIAAQSVSKLQSMSLTDGELSPAFHSGTVDYNFDLNRKATSTTLTVTPIPQFTGSLAVTADGVPPGGYVYSAANPHVAIPITKDTTSLGIVLIQSMAALDLRVYNVSVRRPLIEGMNYSLREIASPGNFRNAGSISSLPDGRVMLSGGLTVSSVSIPDAEIYDPATDSWSAGPMNFGASYARQESLVDGRILLAGGAKVSGGAVSYNGSQIYDPVSGLWVDVAPMGQARIMASSAVLTDGRVLVVGGTYQPPGGSRVLRDPEIFNPVTGSWSPVEALGSAPYYSALTKLADGRVMLAGGMD
ncbi:MAG: hypothetical protein EOP84_32555, partial [Verrucomicrobiaceae bacterium]